MKTNLNINKIDLFQIDREKNNGPKKQIKESGYLSDSAPVKVDISSEAMERYRNSVQQNTPKVTELKDVIFLPTTILISQPVSTRSMTEKEFLLSKIMRKVCWKHMLLYMQTS